MKPYEPYSFSRWPDYNEVTSRLLVGGEARHESEFDDLAAQGVTHVLDCRWEPFAAADDWRKRGVKYLHNPTMDDGIPKDTAWFKRGLDFGVPAIRGGGKLYVHCSAGINRGPSMAYAVLGALGWSPMVAFGMLKGARPIVRIWYKDDADRALIDIEEQEEAA